MGWIWNVMLSFGNEEFWEDGEDEARDTCAPLNHINQWMHSGTLVSLVEPTYKPGGGSGMDANLFGGGYKHFDIEAFVRTVEAQAWKDPAKVQLWIKGGEEGASEAIFTPVELTMKR